ncbi:MAG: Cytosolic acyl coenzyme thioester hydrolase, inducible [Myxococcaceae bacterium]|nr:Cytosolic acyl coenzyme thioester hydrolase, inducible [Myxococcaceae bacterium]
MRAFASSVTPSVTWLGLLVLALQGCGASTSEPAPPPASVPPVVEVPAPVRGDVHVTFARGAASVSRLQWGEAFAVLLDGLIPGEEITLRSSTKLADGNYVGEAVFAADASGRIDTGTTPAVRGTYTGADADGLIWSMAKTTKAIPAADPFAFHVEAVAADGTALGGASLTRWYVLSDITRVPVSDNGLVGVFYAPPGKTKLPVIVTFGGSEGGLSSGEDFAMYWASRGYAALGLAYFAATGLPDDLTEVPLEYFEKAFAWVDTRPEVDATKLAVMGGSRGGELALLLGASFPRVKAVVAEVPSGVSWGALASNGSETASWTFRGEKLAFIPYSGAAPTPWTTATGEKAPADTPIFRDSIAKSSPAQLAAASFKVEQTSGPILMLAGGDDQLWPSCDLAKIAMDRLVANGHDKRFADESVCYPDSGHFSAGTPGIPTTGATAVVHPLTGELLALGGTPKGIAKAQRDAFGRIDKFLAASLK